MTYVVAFEANNKVRDYTKFFDTISEIGEMMSIIKNVVIIRVTDHTKIPDVDALAHYLMPCFDTLTDKLLIYNVTGQRPNGLQTEDTWKWLNDKISG